MSEVRNAALRQGAALYQPGQNVACEAGRRVGLIQGIDLLTEAVVSYMKDTDERDDDL